MCLRLTAVPSPSQEPFPAEKSGEDPKGQHSKGLPPTLTHSVEKSCDEQGKETQIMVAYHWWAEDNKADDASERKYGKNLHT